MASRLCHISLHVKLHCSGIKEEKRFPAQPPPLNPSIPHPPSASSGDVLITSTIVTSATVTKTYRWGSRRQQYYYFRRFLISTTSIRSVREVGAGLKITSLPDCTSAWRGSRQVQTCEHQNVGFKNLLKMATLVFLCLTLPLVGFYFSSS